MSFKFIFFFFVLFSPFVLLFIFLSFVPVYLSCCPTVQQGSRSLRASSVVVSSLCPQTARGQRRSEREKTEEEQQRRKRRDVLEQNRKEGTERHLLRPRQLSLQVRKSNKIWSISLHASMSEGCPVVSSVMNLTQMNIQLGWLWGKKSSLYLVNQSPSVPESISTH